MQEPEKNVMYEVVDKRRTSHLTVSQQDVFGCETTNFDWVRKHMNLIENTVDMIHHHQSSSGSSDDECVVHVYT